MTRAQDHVDDRALLHDFRSRRARVPSLDQPTGAVRTRSTWTGADAERLHRDELTRAPAFGRPGGGIQVRYMQGTRSLTVQQLRELGVLR